MGSGAECTSVVGRCPGGQTLQGCRCSSEAMPWHGRTCPGHEVGSRVTLARGGPTALAGAALLQWGWPRVSMAKVRGQPPSIPSLAVGKPRHGARWCWAVAGTLLRVVKCRGHAGSPAPCRKEWEFPSASGLRLVLDEGAIEHRGRQEICKRQSPPLGSLFFSSLIFGDQGAGALLPFIFPPACSQGCHAPRSFLECCHPCSIRVPSSRALREVTNICHMWLILSLNQPQSAFLQAALPICK